jgi:monoamine oxidase
VLLGAFANGLGAYRLAGMTPEERIEAALAQGSVFHPESYRKEFVSGASVAWSRVPWTLGCCARWNEEAARRTTRPWSPSTPHRAGRRARFLCRLLDGGRAALLLDAITRLHKRALGA